MNETDILTAGLSRQSNPTPVLEGVRVPLLLDDLGRPVVTHVIRDLVYSASASLTTGTATTLFSGTATFFADLVQLTASNNSNAAATVALLDESTTMRTLVVPAGNTIHLVFDPALKQSATGTNWSVDMEDITGTTVSIAAEFKREI